MSRLKIERNPKRVAVMLALGGTREKPNILIPLYKLDDSELNELVDALLEKRGLGHQKAIVEKEMELSYEYRRKVGEVRKELKRRIKEQAEFPKLKYGGLKPPSRITR